MYGSCIHNDYGYRDLHHVLLYYGCWRSKIFSRFLQTVFTLFTTTENVKIKGKKIEVLTKYKWKKTLVVRRHVRTTK